MVTEAEAQYQLWIQDAPEDRCEVVTIQHGRFPLGPYRLPLRIPAPGAACVTESNSQST
jgi:hypothetical protein